jgi:hypothetical protein
MYMTAKYPGKCSKTGRDILPGDRIIYYRSTRKAVLVSGTRSATFNDNGVSTTVYRNAWVVRRRPVLWMLHGMTPTVDQLLDLLLDGDPVAWQITRENDSLRIVGLMQSGKRSC